MDNKKKKKINKENTSFTNENNLKKDHKTSKQKTSKGVKEAIKKDAKKDFSTKDSNKKFAKKSKSKQKFNKDFFENSKPQRDRKKVSGRKAKNVDEYLNDIALLEKTINSQGVLADDLVIDQTLPNKDAKKLNNKNESKALKVRFLGGVGEIGKNMTVLEYGKDIIIIDAGLTFPTDNMPGVDLVIPDVSYLTSNKDRIRGIVITHGHEDHIGSLPYILEELNVPVYGTKLTLTLIENKLRERRINNAVLNCIKPSSVIKLGNSFTVEFINVNHSIAGSVGLAITTPVGVVFHSGDFKIDFTPVSGETMDLNRISEIGKKGVLLLMADSTNIEREGTTMSESVVKDTLDHVFAANSKRRLIIATFASNVHRVQQILDLAVKHKRKVFLSGRSMINIAEASAKIGELNIPQGLICDVEKIENFHDHEVCIISTGTQGEPMSALTRMSSGEFNKVTIGNNDTVVISASVIPGNEKMIYGVINNLYRLGAEVIYESLEPIHVSGHACRGELRVLHTLLKPKFFIPVHGEYRHLKKHVSLAQSLGMKEMNTLIAEIGDTVLITPRQMKFGEKVPSGSRFVDGIGIDGTDSFVLRDRIHLSEDGIVVAVVAIDEYSTEVSSIEVIGKGLFLDENIIEEAKTTVANTLKKLDLRAVRDETELSGIIRRCIKNYVFKATKKNPMILPIVMPV